MDRVSRIAELLVDQILAATVTTVHRFVKADATEDQIVEITGASDVVTGIRALAGTAGDRVEVTLPGGGIRKITYGDTIADGDQVTTDSSGRAIPATAGTYVWGTTKMAGVVGDVGRILFLPQGVKGTAVNRVYTVPLTSIRENDLTALGTAASAAKFGLVAGTHGTASPALVSEAANANSKTDTCRLQFSVPGGYTAAQNLTVTIHAHVDTTPLTVACTLDVQAYESTGEKGISADICATAAQDINSATWADKSFTITGTDLVAGDVLDIELTVVANDTGGAVNKAAELGKIKITVPETV